MAIYERLSNFHFMCFDRYEIHVQALGSVGAHLYPTETQPGNVGYGTANLGYGTTNADAGVGFGMSKGDSKN